MAKCVLWYETYEKVSLIFSVFVGCIRNRGDKQSSLEIVWKSWICTWQETSPLLSKWSRCLEIKTLVEVAIHLILFYYRFDSHVIKVREITYSFTNPIAVYVMLLFLFTIFNACHLLRKCLVLRRKIKFFLSKSML